MAGAGVKARFTKVGEGPGLNVGVHMKSESASLLRDASDHLRLALKLLDQAAAPAQIGANVDLALHQLGSALGEVFEDSPPTPVAQGAARH